MGERDADKTSTSPRIFCMKHHVSILDPTVVPKDVSCVFQGKIKIEHDQFHPAWCLPVIVATVKDASDYPVSGSGGTVARCCRDTMLGLTTVHIYWVCRLQLEGLGIELGSHTIIHKDIGRKGIFANAGKVFIAFVDAIKALHNCHCGLPPKSQNFEGKIE
ncbi:unnamed protein product [Dovyalis caffra]|uniref:Uncharacterized protein n=1 Tax=Dovyalis caffra TaxID=77055 RepID=A0AAV1S0S3_9ROSI|nr:unnamed protein product [Dovyalis caffra]